MKFRCFFGLNIFYSSQDMINDQAEQKAMFLSLIYGAHYICEGGISFATWSPMRQVCLGPVGGRLLKKRLKDKLY